MGGPACHLCSEGVQQPNWQAWRPAAPPNTPLNPNQPLAAAAAAPLLLLLMQASASDAKFADYKPKVAFFFPGQGAQSVGMAAEVAAAVPAAKQLFERASDILGYDLLAVCAEGARRPAFACGFVCGCLFREGERMSRRRCPAFRDTLVDRQRRPPVPLPTHTPCPCPPPPSRQAPRSAWT